ncbi:TonB family protein [Achromobacter spanius]|uniref:TonB family protein n=1 Tax=Achromobacter spanius TaxID=217203 RepID=UPI00382F5458
MFDVLGISPTRDSKAIRRAYSIALKQIDQQTQQAAFEHLRAAYERALEWARRADDTQICAEDLPPKPQPITALETSASAEPSAAAAPPATTPAAADFRPRQPQMELQVRQGGGENGRRLARQRARAISQWVHALMQADDQGLAPLWAQIDADPALLHLDAAYEMSSALMNALAERPDGRLQLYQDACARYGWEQQELGLRGGNVVAPLVRQLEEERAMWRRHRRDYRKEHERVIRRVRRDANPSWRKAQRNLAALHRMKNQVPLWLALQMPPGRHQVYLDAAMRVPRYAPVLASVLGTVRKWWWLTLLAVLFIGGAIGEMAKGPSDGRSSAPVLEQTGNVPPLSPPGLKWLTLVPETVRPSGEQVYLIRDSSAPSAGNFQRRLIVPRPTYPFRADLLKQEGTTVVGLKIFPSGRVEGSIDRSSGSPDLDKAALAIARDVRVEGDLPAHVSVAQIPITFALTRK